MPLSGGLPVAVPELGLPGVGGRHQVGAELLQGDAEDGVFEFSRGGGVPSPPILLRWGRLAFATNTFLFL